MSAGGVSGGGGTATGGWGDPVGGTAPIGCVV
jgi:hypothetical protein